MKLHPPGTAPKDGSVFLARFKGRTELSPAAWVPPDNQSFHDAYWVEAHLYGEDFSGTRRIMASLTGWLPMPQIDAEGNVT